MLINSADSLLQFTKNYWNKQTDLWINWNKSTDLFVLFTDQQLADQIQLKEKVLILDEQVQPEFNKLTIRESMGVRKKNKLVPGVDGSCGSGFIHVSLLVRCLIRESAARFKPESFQEEKWSNLHKLAFCVAASTETLFVFVSKLWCNRQRHSGIKQVDCFYLKSFLSSK